MNSVLFKIIFFFGFLFPNVVLSQVIISGKVVDKNGKGLPEANVRLLSEKKALITGTVSTVNGEFFIEAKSDSNYILLFSYVGYLANYHKISTSKSPQVVGNIVLKEDPKFLEEVVVKTTQDRGKQNGDTTQFNADAYKTNPDATAEDLLKKMPGVTSDNSGIKVNGESVQKVLVDGKPFFGDDPNATIKNIPADIIDKVEIFDKNSDQAQFTGFSDGDPSKTINFVTKKGKNIGQFGRVYGGYGVDENSDSRYQAGATLNSFKDKQRVSLLFLSNNINQQNFSSSDITGALGNSAGGNSRGRNNGASALMSPTQNGIITTQALGLNYSDNWGKKIEVSGSYFYNNSSNINTSRTTRSYFTEDNLIYDEKNEAETGNLNHRLNFRFEYAIDSSNRLNLVPSLTFQKSKTLNDMLGTNTVLDNILVSGANTKSGTEYLGYDFSNSVLFMHKFKKKGRSVSLNLYTQLAETDNDGSYQSKTIYSDTSITGLDQEYATYSYSKRISPNVSYTEPLTKFSQLQISYNPSYSFAKSDKQTNNYDAISDGYNSFDTILSNSYDNTYETQKGGLSLRYQKEKTELSFGADVQQAHLIGEQTFPASGNINQSFNNILPNLRYNYRFSKTKNLRIYFRSRTNIPSMTQLQSVMDISNPLQLKTGNSALKQTFENNLFMRFGGFDTKTSRNSMLFLHVGTTNNYIGNAVYVLKTDSMIQGYLAKAGSQLTKPINIDGYQSARAFYVYGVPVKSLKSNVNLNAGFSYLHTPSLVDDQLNFSNSYAPNAGFVIGSNISEKLDFSLSYNGNYTQVKNSVLTKSDNSFYTQTGTFKVNWILLGGLVLNSDFSGTLYTGLSESYNQHYYLWNAYVGYKFLKNKALEAKVSAFDLLNQNRSISRTVTGSYTEDNSTTVLRRYFMFTLTYTLKNFKKGQEPKTETEPGEGPPPSQPGMHRPGGGGGHGPY